MSRGDICVESPLINLRNACIFKRKGKRTTIRVLRMLRSCYVGATPALRRATNLCSIIIQRCSSVFIIIL